MPVIKALITILRHTGKRRAFQKKYTAIKILRVANKSVVTRHENPRIVGEKAYKNMAKRAPPGLYILRDHLYTNIERISDAKTVTYLPLRILSFFDQSNSPPLTLSMTFAGITFKTLTGISALAWAISFLSKFLEKTLSP